MLTSIKPYAAVAALLLGVSSAYANECDEKEPNNPIENAQQVCSSTSGEITIQGMLGNVPANIYAISGDLDFFKFHGKAGKTVDITLTSDRAIYPVIAVFARRIDPSGNELYKKLRQSSVSTKTSTSVTIEKFTFDQDGEYWAAVTHYGRTFNKVWYVINEGGPVTNPTYEKFNYTLSFVGLEPAIKQVSIDIKPGSDSGTWNYKSKGRITVAILKTDDFDPMEEVKPSSLHFGKEGTENNPADCDMEPRDVSGDGKKDLVCHFWNDKTNLDESDTEAKLTGKTNNDLAIEGIGDLKVVPIAKGLSNKKEQPNK